MESPLPLVFAFVGAGLACVLAAFLLGLLAFITVSEGQVRPGKWYDPVARDSLERALRVDQRHRRVAAGGAVAAVVSAFAYPYLDGGLGLAAVVVASAGVAALLWWCCHHGLATGVDKAGGLH